MPYKFNPITGKFDYYESSISNHAALSNLNWSVAGHIIDADIDFNKYKAVEMVCDNGSTLPASPAEGQWFLHTPTGRKILMQYANSAWNPIMSFGTMTIYVDGTSGIDSADKGYGTGANAYATITYAISQIPGLYGGNVIVYIASKATSYAEKFGGLGGKYATGDYSITFQGTLIDIDVDDPLDPEYPGIYDGTATSGVNYAMGAAGVGAVPGVLNDTGVTTRTPTSIVQGASGRDYFCLISHTSAAANQPESGANWRIYWSYAGSSGTGAAWGSGTAYVKGIFQDKLIVTTGGTGSGQTRIVDFHSTTSYKVVGPWATTPNSTTTYKFQDWGTVIDLSGVSDHGANLNGQQRIIFKNLRFDNVGNSYYAILAQNSATFQLDTVQFYKSTTGNTVAVQIVSATQLLISTNILIKDDTTSLYALFAGIRIQNAGNPVITGNQITLSNLKITGCWNQMIFAGFAMTAICDGMVLRSARNSNAIGSQARIDFSNSILTCATSTGMDVALGAQALIRSNVEISISGSHNVNVNLGQFQFVNPGIQVNHAAKWGVFFNSPGLHIVTSAPSYTGNTLGNVAMYPYRQVAMQFDKTNTTLADITGLTFDVEATKSYKFTTELFVDASATGGHKYAIAGTATATAIKYQVTSISNTTNLLVITSRQTALGGSAGQAGATSIFTTIEGTITVNATGTLTVQFAQNAASGTSSVLTLSTFEVKES